LIEKSAAIIQRDVVAVASLEAAVEFPSQAANPT
jgi:hypothetical protein